jgi:hypothetical protein
MAVGLTNYTGNAGLGVGSSNVPLGPTNPNLDVVNNTLRDIMLLDNQRNVMLFQQKVKDRDALTEMIMKNQVSSGDILPEYRRHFDQAEKNAEKSFQEWGGNLNDKDGYWRYQAAIQDLRDIAGHAQGKTMGVRALESDMAKETLPWKKEDMKRWYDKQKAQPFWEPVTPYQQMFSFNMADFDPWAKPQSKITSDPKNPAFKYEEQYFDYGDILKNARYDYLNQNRAAASTDQLVDQLQLLRPDQLVSTLDAVDAQLDRYNQERGLTPGAPGHAPKIKRQVVNGQTLIAEPKVELAAKLRLSQERNFITRTPKFDKDIAKYGIDKAKLALLAKKAGYEGMKANAYAKNLDAKTNKFVRDQMTVGTDVSKMYVDFVKAMQPRGISLSTKDNKETGRLDAVFIDELPQGYQFINGPVVATDVKGKPNGKITVGRLDPFETTKGGKRSYYIPKYVDAQTGEKITVDSPIITDTYNDWRRKNNYRGSKEDVLRSLILDNQLELILQGKNGSANYTSMAQSAKTINAAATTKGEENIMNPPASLPNEPEEQQ